MESRLASFASHLHSSPPTPTPTFQGKVIATQGPLILATLPQARIGDFCTISLPDSSLHAQVIAFDNEVVKLSPFEAYEGLTPGAVVSHQRIAPHIVLREPLLGQVLDASGARLHSRETGVTNSKTLYLRNSPPSPLHRKPVREQLFTGIRSIDGLCPLGYGQRIGLFAGPGVGKSTLLGMLVRNAQCDVSIVALVGERGREVREFIEDSLGEDGMRRSVVVVSTSDEPPARRALAATTAHALAELYRGQGKRVLLLVDSLTRIARAIRDVSLSAGELPVRQGYTPSVYLELPRMLERAGNDSTGSITAIYTVLTNGDQENDPLAEEVKSLLDGHLVLNPKISRMGIWPALDVLNSVSRVASKITASDTLAKVQVVRHALHRLSKDKDMIIFGGVPDPELRHYLDHEAALYKFLNQASYVSAPQSTLSELAALAALLSRIPTSQGEPQGRVESIHLSSH